MLKSAGGRPWGHWAMLFALVAMWGSSFLATKLAVTVWSPVTIVAARLILAALILIGVLLAVGRPLPSGTRLWHACIMMACVGNIFPFTLITWGQRALDSGLAGILMAVMPLATLVLAHFFVSDERLTARQVVGFVLGFLGIVVVMGPEALLHVATGGSALFAQLAVLGGAICYAVNVILARRRPASEPVQAAAAVSVAASLMMVPVAGAWSLAPSMAVAMPATIATEPSLELYIAAALSVVFLGLIATALATVVYFRLVTAAGPAFLSYINYLIPLWALALGIVVLGEDPKPTALVGLFLVLFGLGLSEWRRHGSVPASAENDAGPIPRAAEQDRTG